MRLFGFVTVVGPVLLLLLLFSEQSFCYDVPKPPKEVFNDPYPQITENIVSYLVRKGQQKVCSNKPLFLTIANVGSRLYWKLIENFFYTMEKFGHRDCAVLVCISDLNCVALCREYGFDCYDYQHPQSSYEKVHIMEQVSTVKLFYLSRILAKGVPVMLLDLDIGFLKDPALLYKDFFAESSQEQIRSQMDVMWTYVPTHKVYYTSPRLNFGLVLLKPHPLSVKILEKSWIRYDKVPIARRQNVAIDQNIFGGLVGQAKWKWNYNWSYFDIGYELDVRGKIHIRDEKVYLLHKMDKVTPGAGIRFELGGEVAAQELQDVVAVHATCYEKSTKLLALQNSNAYWDKALYSPERRTLTKPLMMFSRRGLRQELLMLSYLAISTNRELIIPNVLLGMGNNISGSMSVDECLANQYLYLPLAKSKKSNKMSDDAGPPSASASASATVEDSKTEPLRVNRRGVDGLPYCTELWKQSTDPGNNEDKLSFIDHWATAAEHKGELYWPGFRIMDQHVYNKLPPDITELVRDHQQNQRRIGSDTTATTATTTGAVGKSILEHVVTDLKILPPSFYYNMDRIHNSDRIRTVDIPEPFLFPVDVHKFSHFNTNGEDNAQFEGILTKENCHLPFIWSEYASKSGKVPKKRGHRSDPKLYLDDLVSRLSQVTADRVVLDVFDSSFAERIDTKSDGDMFNCDTTGTDNMLTDDLFTPLRSGSSKFDVMKWAKDSSGTWNTRYDTGIPSDIQQETPIRKESYIPLPFVDYIMNSKNYRNTFSLCSSILKKTSNLTCFDKC